MATVLVTGATGFIAKHLVRELLEISGRLPKGCPGRSQLSPRGSPGSADRLLTFTTTRAWRSSRTANTLKVVEEGRPYSHPLSRSSPDSHFPTRCRRTRARQRPTDRAR
jgi:hypothetical protein